jgi:hypothetical protein
MNNKHIQALSVAAKKQSKILSKRVKDKPIQETMVMREYIGLTKLKGLYDTIARLCDTLKGQAVNRDTDKEPPCPEEEDICETCQHKNACGNFGKPNDRNCVILLERLNKLK